MAFSTSNTIPSGNLLFDLHLLPWLKENRMHKYFPILRNFSLQQILDLSLKDLFKLGFTQGAAGRMLKMIVLLKNNPSAFVHSRNRMDSQRLRKLDQHVFSFFDDIYASKIIENEKLPGHVMQITSPILTPNEMWSNSINSINSIWPNNSNYLLNNNYLFTPPPTATLPTRTVNSNSFWPPAIYPYPISTQVLPWITFNLPHSHSLQPLPCPLYSEEMGLTHHQQATTINCIHQPVVLVKHSMTNANHNIILPQY